MKKLIILALAMLTISLTGCGTTSPASGGAPAVVLPAYYVNAAVPVASAASATGTLANPFKTITKALNAASVSGANINLTPGNYTAANGEVFPLKLSNNINIIGAGSTTVINGSGVGYTISGGVNTGLVPGGEVIVVPPNVTATISGCFIGGAWDVPVIVDKGTVTISNCNIDGVSGGSDAIWIYNGANVTLTNNTITGSWWVWGAMYIADAGTNVTLRGNKITDSNLAAIKLNSATTAPTVNLGTAGNPGNNIILGGAGDVGLNITAASNSATIQASGNTWHPNIQGANATGQYPVGTLIPASTVALVAGNNYAVTGLGTAGIQFYTAPTHPKKK